MDSRAKKSKESLRSRTTAKIRSHAISKSRIIGVIFGVMPLLIFGIVFFQGLHVGLLSGLFIGLLYLFFAVYYKLFKKMHFFLCVYCSCFMLVGTAFIFGDKMHYMQLIFTAVNLIIGLALRLGLALNKNFYSFITNDQNKVQDDTQVELSRKWSYIHLVVFFANEVVRRGFSQQVWVVCACFIFPAVYVLFACAEHGYVQRGLIGIHYFCLLYTSPSPRDA